METDRTVRAPSAGRECVLVLDFGSQYTQLIARRCREEGVFSLIAPWNFPADQIRRLNPVGIILSGGPSSVYDPAAPQRWDDLAQLSVPLLGVCYGMHLMVAATGGKVKPAGTREYGRAQIQITGSSLLLRGLERCETVWMSHGDQVAALGSVFRQVALSDAGLPAVVEAPERKWFGVQFHPEVYHTPCGDRVIRNFLYDICGARGGWNMGDFVAEAVRNLRAAVGDRYAVCALSGGVDSAVAATLVHQAVGDRLRCIFVDTGLLRKNETRQVADVFSARFGPAFRVVHAAPEFFAVLEGIADPETKRTRIGHQFIEVFRREAAAFSQARFLVQGTIYPDVIESASSTGPADKIKTHHNVGGLPADLGLELIEPLRDLFKDEVRQVGRELGLPESLLMRHPFPGPGLAVRIIGEVTPEAVAMLQQADAIFIEELRHAGWYDRVSQAFAVLLPVRTVGVMGDGRTYQRVLALRSVDTRDFMTADFSPLPHELLARIASRITNEVRGINRVVFDVTSKPPATVEWE